MIFEVGKIVGMSHFPKWLHQEIKMRYLTRQKCQFKLKYLIIADPNNGSSIQLFFCGNLSSNNAPTWHHFVCSLKKGDVGYCGKLTGMRGSQLSAESFITGSLIWETGESGGIHEALLSHVVANNMARNYFAILKKKAHPFAEIWTLDPNHDPVHIYAQDHSAMAPYLGPNCLLLLEFERCELGDSATTAGSFAKTLLLGGGGGTAVPCQVALAVPPVKTTIRPGLV